MNYISILHKHKVEYSTLHKHHCSYLEVFVNFLGQAGEVAGEAGHDLESDQPLTSSSSFRVKAVKILLLYALSVRL